jgi:benzylsuccinate CoA-transferase BbsF subunit
MRDGETQLIGEYILDCVLNGRVQERMANRHPTMSPHNVYRCRGEDSWLAVAVATDAEWASLCRVMEHPELVDDAAFATVLARKRNEAHVDAVVAAWAATQERSEAMHLLQKARVSASAVMTTEDIANDAQFLHRKAFQVVPLGGADRVRLQRAAWTAKRASIQIGAGPGYSEHTQQVLRGLLNMTDSEIDELAAAGAIVLPEKAEEPA